MYATKWVLFQSVNRFEGVLARHSRRFAMNASWGSAFVACARLACKLLRASVGHHAERRDRSHGEHSVPGNSRIG